MENSDTLPKIIQVVESHKGADGWTDLAALGKSLNDEGINYKALGYLKLRELLEDYSESLEIKKDSTTHKVPVVYVRVKTEISQPKSVPPVKPNLKLYSKAGGNGLTSSLMDWASMGDFRQAISDLKNVALKERWYYKTQNPANPYPILASYFNYTFYRLSKEKGKIKFNDQYAAFNTGLVDNLYEPIYALFGKNKLPNRREWKFQEFCTSGVGRAGKILASNFNPLPERAQFFVNPAELIYDTNAPEPQMNWNHIILDNVSRLPLEFLEDNKPTGFLLRETSTMNTVEKNEYFESLAAAIESDSKKFRTIKNRFADSLSLALKRVQWNFKTAIPMYYPRNDKMSLLLPLSLIDDEVIDIALVAEKTPSGSYLGHTILQLDWAYSNARLVTRPDSDWLIAEKIEVDNNIESEDKESE